MTGRLGESAFHALKKHDFTLVETDVAKASCGVRREDHSEPLLDSDSEHLDDEFHFEDRLDQRWRPQQPALKSLEFLSCREPPKQAIGLSLLPLHEAAEQVMVREMVEILITFSKPVMGLKAVSETVVRLGARRGQVQAVRFLVECCRATSFVSSKYDYIDTVLRLAISRKNLQTLRLFPEDNAAPGGLTELNAKNNCGFTALDILDNPPETGNRDTEIKKMLQRTGDVRGRDMADQESNKWNLEIYIEPRRLCQQPFHDAVKCGSLKSTTDLMLILMTLIATMTLKLALRPPSGFAQGYESSSGSLQVEKQDVLINQLFILFNSVAFFTSIALMTILLQDFPFKPWLQMLVFSTIGSYICGVKINSPHEVPMVLFVGTSISLAVFLIYLASHKMIADYLQSKCCRPHETEKPWSLMGASSFSLPSPINNV